VQCGRKLEETGQRILAAYMHNVSLGQHTQPCAWSPVEHRAYEQPQLWWLTVSVIAVANNNNNTVKIYRVAQKSKPLPNHQKIILNRIKACQ